jgi:hypothetical protein
MMLQSFREPRISKVLDAKLSDLLGEMWKMRTDPKILTLTFPTAVEPGILVALGLSLIPVAVYCYFPVVWVRRFIAVQRLQLWVRSAGQIDEADSRAEPAILAIERRRMKALQKQSFWINGVEAGWGFLAGFGLLFAGSAVPPILVLGFASGFALWVIRYSFRPLYALSKRVNPKDRTAET